MMRIEAWRTKAAALRPAFVAVALACAPAPVLAIDPTESRLTFEGSGLFAKFPREIGESNKGSELCQWGVWAGGVHWSVLVHCHLIGTRWYQDRALNLETVAKTALFLDAEVEWGEAFKLSAAKGTIRARLATADGDRCATFVTGWGQGESGKNTILVGSLCTASASTDLKGALTRELGFIRVEGAFERLIPPP